MKIPETSKHPYQPPNYQEDRNIIMGSEEVDTFALGTLNRMPDLSAPYSRNFRATRANPKGDAGKIARKGLDGLKGVSRFYPPRDS